MFIIGLTGGIGSGKSVVAGYFSQLGVPIIDADKVSKELCFPGKGAFKKIYERFGETIIDRKGEIDRKKLKAIVFKSKSDKLWLECLLHPLIIEAILDWSKSINAPYCIAVAPLLLETAMKDYVDRVLVIDCPEEIQLERASLRDLADKAAIKSVLEAQISRSERLKSADDIITNEGSLEELKAKVVNLDRFYRSL